MKLECSPMRSSTIGESGQGIRALFQAHPIAIKWLSVIEVPSRRLKEGPVVLQPGYPFEWLCGPIETRNADA
jgi:hypothetical protein